MALPNRGARRDGNHDVGELTATGLPHAQAAQLDRRLQRLDRRQGGRLRLGRRAIHQHVDIDLDQTCRREQHEHADEERGDRVAVRMAAACEEQPDEHGERAGEVAPEMQGVRSERSTPVPTRRAPGDCRAAQVDREHNPKNCEGVPGRTHLGIGRACKALDCAHGDEDARHREKPGLAECREMLRLAVAVLVRDIRGACRETEREERQQRRDEVGPRMDRLGDEAEAVRRQADAELEDDERRCGGNRDER